LVKLKYEAVGKIEEHLLHVKSDNGVNQLFQLYIGATTPRRGVNHIDPTFWGKYTNTNSSQGTIWSELKASNREDALEELIDKLYNHYQYTFHGL
jgi:hypothetical protein